MTSARAACAVGRLSQLRLVQRAACEARARPRAPRPCARGARCRRAASAPAPRRRWPTAAAGAAWCPCWRAATASRAPACPRLRARWPRTCARCRRPTTRRGTDIAAAKFVLFLGIFLSVLMPCAWPAEAAQAAEGFPVRDVLNLRGACPARLDPLGPEGAQMAFTSRTGCPAVAQSASTSLRSALKLEADSKLCA
jgi:hypothetical protein